MTDRIYKLSSINLTRLGGPMGTESTFVNWSVYSDDLDLLKEYGHRRYDGDRMWKWRRKRSVAPNRFAERRVSWTSGDLGHVEYEIVPIELLRRTW